MTCSVLLLGCLIAGPGDGVGSEKSPLLVFRNEDYLPGTPVEDERGIGWASDWFGDEAVFDPAGILRIELPPSEFDDEPGPARVVLWNGNVFGGEIVGGDEDTLTLESLRHGEVCFRRDAVRRIENLYPDGALVFDGTAGLIGWRSLGKQHDLSQWTGRTGELSTDKEQANLFAAVDLSDAVFVDLECSAPKGPGFRIAFGASPDVNELQYAFSLEVMRGTLVAHRQAGGRLEFEPIQVPAVARRDETVSVQFLFSPKEGRLLVYSEGALCGTFEDVRELDALHNGFFLRNTTKSLKIGRLRVSRWRGEFDEDGQPMFGDHRPILDGSRVVRIAPDLSEVVLAGEDGAEESYGRTQFEVIDFPNDDAPRDKAGNGHITAVYSDGALVTGLALHTVEDGLWVDSPSTVEPFLVSWDGLERIDFDTSEEMPEVDEWRGMLEFEGLRIHGRVVDGTEGGSLIWNPIYSEDEVTFDLGENGRVTLGGPVGIADLDGYSDELHLVQGDVIACHVVSVGEESLDVELPDGSGVTLPRKKLKALRLGSESRQVARGFDDFTINRSEVTRRDDGSLAMSGSGEAVLKKPLPQRLHIALDTTWAGNGMVTVGVGSSDDIRGQGSEHISFTFHHQDGRVTGSANLSSNENQGFIIMDGDSFSGSGRPVDLGASSTAHLDVYVDLAERQYEIHANGTQILADKWRSRPFEPAAVFVTQRANPQNVVWIMRNGRAEQMQNESAATVRAIEIGGWSGHMDDGRRQRLLTRRAGVPADRMSQVLRSFTGDCLRGRLLSVDHKMVLFESKLEPIKILRERVAELIELRPMAAPAPPEEGQEVVTIHTHGGGVITLRPGACDDEAFHGTSSILGEYSIPWAWIFSLQIGQDGHERPPSPYRRWVQIDPLEVPDAAGAPADDT